MIRLTINATSDPEIHLFNKNTLLLGSDPSLVDLVLETDDHPILPVHLKIVEQEGFLILINQANDPFVSINGQPFGKKLLNSGDVIIVHQKEILFENLSKPGEINVPKQPPLPLENDCPLPPFEKTPLIKTPAIEKTSLKDDYLRDLEDDNQNSFKINPDSSHLKQAWKLVFLIIASLLSLSFITGSIVYFTASDKADAQEVKAAQAVADVAMALTHAKLNYLKPHNQNWADVEFLKNNLHNVLPNTTSYASHLDVQGQLNCCPYSLRIYTNSDFTHFVLIAQPSPSLLHWLIPKSIIVVDSSWMELRSLKEVRSLNRLLANSDPLEGPNAKEISALIKEGSLIPLSALAHQTHKMDFLAPPELREIKAGAENIIYNAPRYYRLSHGLKKKIMTLQGGKGGAQEVTNLKQDVELFSQLYPFILYDEEGKKSALTTHKGLRVFAPAHKFLIGYLILNEDQKITEVHFLNEKDQEETLAYVKPAENLADQEKIPSSTPIVSGFNHPLYIQLQTLTMARENEMKPLYNSLVQLLSQELQKPSPSFQSDYLKLMHQTLRTDFRHKLQIKEVIDMLYHQYEDMPFNQFMSYIKQLRLEQLIQEVDDRPAQVDESAIQNLDNILTHVKKAKSLAELDDLIILSNSWLSIGYLQNGDEVIKYENLLRNELLFQLEKALLQDISSLKKEDRSILESLLSHEKLIQEEEKAFFIEEFDNQFPKETVISDTYEK
ncbi:MAG: FHA domain-containing protein [Parachlamydia sp.]|jgi:hypothetical protein|nr:FHA domain-containing protein [Parachlamydia sp.]